VCEMTLAARDAANISANLNDQYIIIEILKLRRVAKMMDEHFQRWQSPGGVVIECIEFYAYFLVSLVE